VVVNIIIVVAGLDAKNIDVELNSCGSSRRSSSGKSVCERK